MRAGDSLWEIAYRELGDPMRWPEIYKLNRGKPQPHRGALADPDLIQPGWVLRLPAKPTATTPPNNPQQGSGESQQEGSGQSTQQ
ncbi:MAG: LysM peptidoglycan-binding domain-containing protein, partial [Micromonosporaceae bacterium]